MFIRDDAAQRSLHEAGEKHKGNLERYIRNLYKGGERAKREKEAEKRQFERIEAVSYQLQDQDFS
jgi:WW domain-binding protein 4